MDGLVQDCSNSGALTMELLQSCAKPSKCIYEKNIVFNSDFTEIGSFESHWQYISIVLGDGLASHYMN